MFTTIKERREALGMSNAKLSALLGVHPSAITHWEQGKNLPTLRSLEALAVALKCKPGDLIEMGVRDENQAV